MQEQITVVIASGTSTSSNALFSRTYPIYSVQVGTMSTGMVFGIHQSRDAGVSFYQVMNPPNPTTSTVTNLTMQIGSNVGVGGGFIMVPGGYNGMRFVLTGVVSGGASFNVLGIDG